MTTAGRMPNPFVPAELKRMPHWIAWRFAQFEGESKPAGEFGVLYARLGERRPQREVSDAGATMPQQAPETNAGREFVVSVRSHHAREGLMIAGSEHAKKPPITRRP